MSVTVVTDKREFDGVLQACICFDPDVILCFPDIKAPILNS